MPKGRPYATMTTIVEQGRAQPTESKSLYISHSVSNFYGIKIEILAGFGAVRNVLKKNGRIISIFRSVFSCFQINFPS